MPKTDTISAASSVREVLTRHPEAEVVFERHGLLGCGGPNGPREPIGFFAWVHRVDPTLLVRELNQFLREANSAAPSEARPRFSVIYPLFLMTSLAIALLAGFTTGMLALASASLDRPLPGISWPIFVQVHGRIQLYGWAGLFVMGVAYHVVPRFVATPLARPRLVYASYAFAVLGVALSTAQVVADPRLLAFGHELFVAGLILVMLAAICYLLVLVATVQASAHPVELPIRFVLVGALWFVLGAAFEAIVGWRSVAGEAIPSPAEEPALTALLVGFLVVTALGVSLRTLPVFLGLAKTRERVPPVAFPALQLGVLALVGGDLLAGDLGLERAGLALAAIGALIVLGGVLAVVWALRLFKGSALPVAEMGTGRGWTRAVRLAYVWLLVGLGLLAEELLRAVLRGTSVPWNTMGAARHALAVGFVTSPTRSPCDTPRRAGGSTWNPSWPRSTGRKRGYLNGEEEMVAPMKAVVTAEDVIRELTHVYDPEIGIDIVNLGLVYEVEVESGAARVRMTFTTPGCPVGPMILDDVQAALKSLPLIQKVEINLIWDPPWEPAMMSPEAKAELGWTD